MTVTDCGAPVRGFPNEKCSLPADHKGTHSCVTFSCDGCGKTRRGQPWATAHDGEYLHGLKFCFLCVRGKT